MFEFLPSPERAWLSRLFKIAGLDLPEITAYFPSKRLERTIVRHEETNRVAPPCEETLRADAPCNTEIGSANAVSLSECPSPGQAQATDDLDNRLRQKQKTLLDQSQRIEELESVLTCIVYLADKRKKLELENDV